jgi:hypothetical protein
VSPTMTTIADDRCCNRGETEMNGELVWCKCLRNQNQSMTLVHLWYRNHFDSEIYNLSQWPILWIAEAAHAAWDNTAITKMIAIFPSQKWKDTMKKASLTNEQQIERNWWWKTTAECLSKCDCKNLKWCIHQFTLWKH